MQITGEQALVHVTESDYYTLALAQSDHEQIALDDLFAALDAQIANPNLLHLELVINGGVAENGTTLSLETNVINLPQRYTNQLKKLIWPEKIDNDVNLYMIVENPVVSQSQLKISLASSVAAYQDDPDSVKQKISEWFDTQLQTILAQQETTEGAEES